jgi:hypothetical protein
VEFGAIIVRDQRPADRDDAAILHRSLQFAPDLGGLDGTTEEAHDRPFDQALDELLCAIEYRHFPVPATSQNRPARTLGHLVAAEVMPKV